MAKEILKIKTNRARNQISAEKRDIIFSNYNGLCAYCLLCAEEIDHIIPWSYNQDDSLDNLVPVCWLCNQIASNRMFETFEKKRQWVLATRYKLIKNNIIIIWTKEELSEMGYAIRRKIEQTCIVAKDDKEALEIKERLHKLDLQTILHKTTLLKASNKKHSTTC